MRRNPVGCLGSVEVSLFGSQPFKGLEPGSEFVGDERLVQPWLQFVHGRQCRAQRVLLDRMEPGRLLPLRNLRLDAGSKTAKTPNLFDRILHVAAGRHLTPPRLVILGEKHLTVPPRQVEFRCEIPILQALETVEQQCGLTSTHAEHDHLGVLLTKERVVHMTTLSRKPTAVKPCRPSSAFRTTDPVLALRPRQRSSNRRTAQVAARRRRIIHVATKLMAIRRPDTCAGCAVPLPPKTQAWWDSSEKSVTCTTCRPADQQPTVRPSPKPATPTATSAAPKSLAPPVPIDHGTGGISAQKEYERRAAKHAKQIEDKWGTGRIGKVAKFFADEPQSTTAWAKGADGEIRLANRLDRDLDGIATVLHDRKVPLSRGNIDHLVVAPTGIWIIDAKNYSGKVECRDVGGWRTSDERLYVANRNRTKLVAGMGWQADAVRLAIEPIGFGAVPVHRCLCFTNAEWGLFSKPFVIDDVWIGWAKALVEAIHSTPVLDAAAVTTLSHHLSSWFPASS